MTAFERQGGKITTTEKNLCTGKVIEVIEVQSKEDIQKEIDRINRLEDVKAIVFFLVVGIFTLLAVAGIINF